MERTLYQSLLMVSDIDASRDFYEEVIGLHPKQVQESNVEYVTGQATFVLESDFDQEVLDTFGLSYPGEDRGDGAIIAINVEKPDNVDTVYERAVETNRIVLMEPRDVDWGRRMLLLEDPDGYTIDISASL